jgi:drug/metabolite transporter (DMT)-like permease
VAFALGSAAAFAIYLLVSNRLVVRTDALTTGAWMALGAGLSFFVRAVVTGALRWPGSHLPAAAGNGLATASAFALLFAAMRLLGPTRTSVVMTLEAFFAIVLAAVFLGEGLKPLQAVGGAAILMATALVAVSRRVPTEV